MSEEVFQKRVVTLNELINVKNIYKNFGSKKVIDDISFQLNSKESMVMLGLNGAGKTTTISMLLGLLKPTSGQIFIMGSKPGDIKLKKRISCLPQASTFPAQLKVKEVIDFMSAHYNDINNDIMDIFSLSGLMNSPLKNLSGGQKRRVSLACAFIGNPELVFLDEPTAGVDVSQKKIIWKFLQDFQNNGGSLFLTTHDLIEAELLSQNLIFLHQGKIVEKGTRQDLKKKFSLKKIKFKSSLEKIIFNNKSIYPHQNVFELSAEDEIAAIEMLLNNYKDNIVDLTVSEMSLMEVVDDIEVKQ